MIKYKLLCNDCKLNFDSWFSTSSEYEKLKKKKLLICHNCNSEKVEKTLMAPQLISRKAKNEEKFDTCLLYTSPSPRDMRRSRMPSSA